MDRNAMFHKFVVFTAAVHQIANDMTKDVRAESITLMQYKILEYVAIHQPVTPSEIGECMHMSMPNTSRELRKLTDKQLCEKAADTEDRRKQFIRLSAKGEAMMKEAFQTIAARFNKRIETASDEELKEIEHALDLLHAKIFY